MDSNKFFTRNNIYDIIDIFDNFLEDYNIRIPASDEELLEDYSDFEENTTRLYGTVCGDLEDRLLEYFEVLEQKGTISQVVNSWNDEVEEW